MTTPTEPNAFVIYSANEAALNDGAGFWNNDNGWMEDVSEATRFTEIEAQELNLPMSTGQDAKWCLEAEFDNEPVRPGPR